MSDFDDFYLDGELDEKPKNEQKNEPNKQQQQKKKKTQQVNNQSYSGEMRYAGFWVRVAALFIDIIILLAFNFSLELILFQEIVDIDHKAYPLALGISSVISILYYAGFESSQMQATFGKKAMKIKVVDENGHRIDFTMSIIRYFCHWLSSLTLGIGYIMVAFHPQKKGLHDLVAKTLVVYKN